MTDMSGNGYHAAAEAAGATFVSAWSNGKPAVAFPGSGGAPAGGARFTTKATGLVAGMRGPRATIYALFSVTSNPNPMGVKAGRVVSAETPYTAVSNGYNQGFAIASGFADPTRTAVFVDRSTGVLGQGTEYAAPVTALNTPIIAAASRPGDAEVNGTPLGVSLWGAYDLRRINARNRLLGLTAGNVEDMGYCFGSQIGGRFNQHLHGHIAEVLIFARTHTAAERAQMRTYLQTRM
jgi:hypothetical protein